MRRGDACLDYVGHAALLNFVWYAGSMNAACLRMGSCSSLTVTVGVLIIMIYSWTGAKAGCCSVLCWKSFGIS